MTYFSPPSSPSPSTIITDTSSSYIPLAIPSDDDLIWSMDYSIRQLAQQLQRSKIQSKTKSSSHYYHDMKPTTTKPTTSPSSSSSTLATTSSTISHSPSQSSLPQRFNSNMSPKNQSTAINSNSVVNPSSSALKPMKSAMRHSKSQYSVSLNTSNEDSSGSGQYTSNIKFHPRECVPSGLRVGGTTTTPLDHSTSTNGTSQNHGNGTALMMPSGAKYFQPRPQHAAAAAASAPIGSTNSEPTNNSTSFVPGTATTAANAANGYISPQWGWYISTTPPTQEHYASTIASHSATKKNNSSETSADSNTTTNKTTSSTSSQPKPPKVNWSRHPAVTANNKNSPSRHVPTAFITNGGTPANIMMPKKAPPKVFRPFNPTCNTTGWPSVPL